MADSKVLSECFETLHEEILPSLGTEDPLLTRILAARLLIERAGERDANYWWDSQVLNEFGQGRLAETVPRTATRSQIELAMKVGRKVENEKIGEESVSLFDFGPYVESQIQREIDNIDGREEFDILKDLPVEVTESGWTGSFSEGEITTSPGPGTTFEIGSIATDELQEEEVVRDLLSQFIQGYGEATKQDLKIPYFSVK